MIPAVGLIHQFSWSGDDCEQFCSRQRELLNALISAAFDDVAGKLAYVLVDSLGKNGEFGPSGRG